VIVRVLTARVKPGRVSHFNALIRQQLPILREQPGLVYVKLARRLEPDGGEEVVLFEEWRDPDSLYGWAGSDISKPHLLPGAEDSLLELSVTHYESLDIDFETFSQTHPVRPAGPAAAPSPPTDDEPAPKPDREPRLEFR
jgi:heme-degrading monooxygenase HmoA